MISEKDENEKDNDKEKFNDANVIFENQNKKEIETYLFANLRYEYLDKMPPFEASFITIEMYEEDHHQQQQQQQQNSDCSTSMNHQMEMILKKLQALLCSQTIPKQVLLEINAFLSLNSKITGSISLNTLLLNIQDGITYLIDVFPQCLQYYARVRLVLL